MRREVGALLDDGYEVDVVCLRQARERKVASWRSARVYRLPVRHRRGRVARYLWEYASFFGLALLNVSALHVLSRYDVVQVHTLPDPLVFAAVVPKLTGAKVVLDMHELMPEFAAMKFRASRSSLPVRTTVLFERLAARFADAVLAVSVPQASVIEPRHRQAHARRAERPGRSALRRPQHQLGAPAPSLPVVITHGTMTEGYGVQDLIAALPAALRQEQFRVVIVGDGEFLPELKRLASELGLEDHVAFTGRVTPAVLAPPGISGRCAPTSDPTGSCTTGPAAVATSPRSWCGRFGTSALRSDVAARAKAVYEDVRWEKTSQTYLAAVRELVTER